MPFHIRFRVKSSNGRATRVTRVDLTREQLDDFFLIPFHCNGRIINNGTPIRPDDTNDIRISETQESFAELRLLIRRKRTQQEQRLQSASLLYVNLTKDEWYAADYGTDRTDELLRTPPQDFLSSIHSSEESSAANGDSDRDATPVTLGTLFSLLVESESDYLDWKRNWPRGFADGRRDNSGWDKARATVLKDLAALANSESGRQGYLVYGVQDHKTKREVVGINQSDDQARTFDDADFQTWAANTFDPPPSFRYCELGTSDGKTVGIFVVNPVPGYPHVVRRSLGEVLYEGQVWFRRGSKNCVALHDDLERMFKGSEPFRIPKGTEMQRQLQELYSGRGYEIIYQKPESKDYHITQAWQPVYVPGTRREAWIMMSGFDVVMLVRPTQRKMDGIL